MLFLSLSHEGTRYIVSYQFQSSRHGVSFWSQSGIQN